MIKNKLFFGFIIILFALTKNPWARENEKHNVLLKAVEQNEKKLKALDKEYHQQSEAWKAQQALIAKIASASFKEQQHAKLKLLLTTNEADALALRSQYYEYFYKASEKQLKQLQESLHSIEKKQIAIRKEQELNAQLSRAIPKPSVLITDNKTTTAIPRATSKASSVTPSFFASSFAKMKRKLPWPIERSKQKSGVTSSRLSIKNTYLPAEEGASVTAVYPGKVVFSEWLRGVGLLMIIDHGQGYMSLYGNNQKLYKSLGDTVQQGEIIAEVGQSGGYAEGGLYFEIRKDGEQLDPSLWFKST